MFNLSNIRSQFLFSIFLGFITLALGACELPVEDFASSFLVSDAESDICCEYEDGSHSFTSLKACNKYEGFPVSNEACQESSISMCCEIDGTYQLTTSLECKEGNGEQAALEDCNKICCATDHPSYTITTLGSCEDLPGFQVDSLYCEPEPIEVCCKTNNGFVVILETDCEPNQIVDDAYCEEPLPEDVCCSTQDGLATYFTTSDKCEDNYELPLSDCDPHAPLCCRFPDGFQWVNMEECPPQWVSQDQSYCDPTPAEVCCKTADGNLFVPASDCPQALVQPDEVCEPDDTVCCETAGGAVPTLVSACGPDFVLPATACEDYATVCCETATGAAFMSSLDCPVAQIHNGQTCWEQIWNNQLVCCSDVNGQGLGWASQTSCSAAVLTIESCNGVPLP